MTHAVAPSQTVDFIDSTDLLADPAALRARAGNLGQWRKNRIC
jgi:hypothetical protein